RRARLHQSDCPRGWVASGAAYAAVQNTGGPARDGGRCAIHRANPVLELRPRTSELRVLAYARPTCGAAHAVERGERSPVPVDSAFGCRISCRSPATPARPVPRRAGRGGG